MYKLETKELKMSELFKKKIDIICRFACVKYKLIQGNIVSVKNTNLAYVRPHILKVKGNDYLLFEVAIRMILIDDKKIEKENKIRLALITMDMSETKKRCSKDIFKSIMNSSNKYIHNFKNNLRDM